jgi:hypothetical protein
VIYVIYPSFRSIIINPVIKLIYKILFVFITSILLLNRIEAQCNQQYNWTSWQNFSGTTASGIIKNNGQTIKVSMSSNFTFGSSPAINNYAVFNGFDPSLPNSTVPQTTWAAGEGVFITLFQGPTGLYLMEAE